jgi:CO/xanthine dehydrogenase Mo-binding subunit
VAHFDSDEKLTLWSSTQTPHYVHRALAKVLGLAASHIRVIATPNGGGFGGKSDPFNHEVIVAKLSMITGRPVKCTLTREEVFYCHRGRHPVLMHVKTGVKQDGAITGMHFKTFLDGGAYGSYGVASTFYTGALQTVTYEVPRYKFQGVRVFTNKPPCGPKRGHGTPQPRYALEVHLDKIAEQLKLDPAEIRRSHLVKPNSVTANYLRIGSMGLGACIDKVVEGSDWKNKFSWGYAGVPSSASTTGRLRKSEGSLSAKASASPAARISAARVCRSTGTICHSPASNCGSIARAASA